jgi:hypothetical protein
LYIEEEQTTQWPKEKVQKDKHRSTRQMNNLSGIEEVTFREGKSNGQRQEADVQKKQVFSNHIFLD